MPGVVVPDTAAPNVVVPEVVVPEVVVSGVVVSEAIGWELAGRASGIRGGACESAGRSMQVTGPDVVVHESTMGARKLTGEYDMHEACLP